MKYILNFKNIISVFLFTMAFWGVSNTSDWEGYEYLFSTQNSSDGLFNLLSSEFINRGYVFKDLYRFHIILIAVSYVLLFNICKVNRILFTLIVIALFYVDIGNQIRYYLAFPLVYIAYYFYNRKLIAVSLLFASLAIFSHFGGIVIILSLLVIRQIYRKQLFYIYILLINISIYILILAGTNISIRFSSYYESSATLLGGFYLIIPTLISFFLIFKMNSQVFFSFKNDTFYKFIYTASIATSSLCLSATHIIIITSRYLEPCIVFWLAYYIYIYKHCHSKIFKKECILDTTIVLLLFSLYRFVFPFIITKSDYLFKVGQMISSYTLD